jgi:hypothetical protein
MPETLMVHDRHDNRALVVLKDEPLSLREFYVSLCGPEFRLPLLQPLKFWAGHFDPFRIGHFISEPISYKDRKAELTFQ